MTDTTKEEFYNNYTEDHEPELETENSDVEMASVNQSSGQDPLDYIQIGA
jgi:hypothetical protein